MFPAIVKSGRFIKGHENPVCGPTAVPRRYQAALAPMFEPVQLESEQIELLGTLVEAARAVPRDERRFFHIKYIGGEQVQGAGVSISVAAGDIEALQAVGLLRVLSYGDHGSSTFLVAPDGFAFYELQIIEAGEPVQQVEEHLRSYIESERLRARHPESYRLWADAAQRLWGAESQDALTALGHTLREAMQAFATELVEASGVDANPDATKTLDRLSAVVEAKRAQTGETVAGLLDASFAYWRALNGTIQRQEHGASHELVWEDGRRAVFHTMFVMTELDRMLAP